MLEKGIKKLNRVSIRVRASISFRLVLGLVLLPGRPEQFFSHTTLTWVINHK